MGYTATQKQFIISGNTIINPDFGSWRLINYGTNPLVINDTITLQQGEEYKVELDPDVEFKTAINIKFDTTGNGTSRAAMIEFYFKRV